MALIFGRRRERYDLVNAGQEFIFTALPFKHQTSRQALARFVCAASARQLPTPDVDAVLLHLLCVLEPHTYGRLPSLVDRYLATRREIPDCVARFEACVDDVIRYRGVGNADVQRAIAYIEENYPDGSLSLTGVADQLGRLPKEISASFTAHTGVTFGEYLRNVRLDRAAGLLTTTAGRIKEIWAQVGYNDASNFVHQFRDRFGTTPREYRARVIQGTPWTASETGETADPDARAGRRGDARHTLLIVDDDACTRETLGRHFELAGYCVARAATGDAGLSEAAASTPRAVILDHHLPDMDAFEWLHALRSQPVNPRPGVLVFTADWDVADNAREIAALGGMLASKLCDLGEVERLVESLTTWRTTIDEIS